MSTCSTAVAGSNNYLYGLDIDQTITACVTAKAR